MKGLWTLLLLSMPWTTSSLAQDTTLTLTSSLLDADQHLDLATSPGWVFKAGHNSHWATPSLNTAGWTHRRPADLSANDADPAGRAEGWFRLRLRLDSTFQGMPLGIYNYSWAAADLYIDGRLLTSFGHTGARGEPYAEHYPYYPAPFPLDLTSGQPHLLALHVVDERSPLATN